jgi:imidazolonepropionase-like amidohydrolase
MWLKNGQIYDSEKRIFRAGDLKVEGERIFVVGERAPAKAKGSETIDMDGAFLLPGFFDCHVHICVPTDSADPSSLWKNALPGDVAIYAARAARRILLCGVTTARDVGGWDYHEIAVREAIGQGLIEGPRLYCSGRILTITSSTTPYYRGMYEEADGAEAVKRAARLQLAQGADFIKLLATGAITSTKYEKAEAIQYRREEIAAAVAIAGDNLTYVAAHAHAKEGILNAVEAGCHSIEHGSFGDEETYKLMVERGIWLVPTLCVTPAMFKDARFAQRVPPHIRTRYEDVHETRVRNMKLAKRCGVLIAMGTDAGTPGNHCGDNMQEIEVMVGEAGFSPAEAIQAATLGAARMMGLEDKLGSLTQGKLADVIATRVNPLKDVTALRAVDFVMKGGRVHKKDGAPTPFL